MQNMILVLHLLICVVLVGAVLMQRSEGGALGMGGGGGGGLISGRGAADMMVNITSWVGGLFFVTSLVLAILAGTRPADRSVIDAAAKPGFTFQIPGLPKAPTTPTTISPAATAPLSSSPTIADPSAPVGAVVPAPAEAVTRAGPLETPPVVAPAVTRQPVGAATKTGAATGAAPRTGQPVGAPTTQKTTTAPAPMIPLPAATTPAPAAESDQPPVPAPPSRQKTGPDQ